MSGEILGEIDEGREMMTEDRGIREQTSAKREQETYKGRGIRGQGYPEREEK
jgi:hypothetical protein